MLASQKNSSNLGEVNHFSSLPLNYFRNDKHIERNGDYGIFAKSETLTLTIRQTECLHNQCSYVNQMNTVVFMISTTKTNDNCHRDNAVNCFQWSPSSFEGPLCVTPATCWLSRLTGETSHSGNSCHLSVLFAVNLQNQAFFPNFTPFDLLPYTAEGIFSLELIGEDVDTKICLIRIRAREFLVMPSVIRSIRDT